MIRPFGERSVAGGVLGQGVLAALILVAVLQQMPIVRELWYEQIRFGLYGVFLVYSLGVVVNMRRATYHPLVKYSVWLFCSFFAFELLTDLLMGSGGFATTFEYLVPFGVLLCSFLTPFSDRQRNMVLGAYVCLVTVVGLSSAVYYNGGFELSAIYDIPSKNQTGPLIGISLVVVLYQVLGRRQSESIKSFWLRFALWAISGLLFTSLLVLRNRSGIVGILIVALLLWIGHLSEKSVSARLISLFWAILVVVALALSGHLSIVAGYVWDSLTLNYDVGEANSLSAGRADVYIEALAYMADNPAFGGMGLSDPFDGTPHNYLLSKAVQYGLVLGLPILAYYVYLWRLGVAWALRRDRLAGPSHLTGHVLLFSLIVSLFEYTYPFGPGTSQVMLWFLLGQSCGYGRLVPLMPSVGRVTGPEGVNVQRRQRLGVCIHAARVVATHVTP